MATDEVTRIRVVCDVCGNDYEFEDQEDADRFIERAGWIVEDGLLLCREKHSWIEDEEKEKAEAREWLAARGRLHGGASTLPSSTSDESG